jgi:hypothetical protein
MYWFNDTAPNHVAATFQRWAALPLRYLAEPPTGASVAAVVAGVLYVLPWMRLRREPALLLPAMWLIGCASLVGVLDLVRGTDQLDWIKYTLLGGPGVYLILPLLMRGQRGATASASSLAEDPHPSPPPEYRERGEEGQSIGKGDLGCGQWFGHLLPAVAVIYCALAVPGAYDNVKGDFKGLAADLDKRRAEEEPVAFAGAGWGDWYTGVLYMGVERYSTKLPRTIILLKGPASPELAAAIPGESCWLVMSWTDQSPQIFLPGWQVSKVNSYPGAAILYRLTRPRL